MNRAELATRTVAGILFLSVAWCGPAWGQPPRPEQGPQPPVVTSPEVQPDGRITFRIHAPQAQAVQLTGSDIPAIGTGVSMNKGENGVWEITAGPIQPGAYPVQLQGGWRFRGRPPEPFHQRVQ